MPAPPFAAPQGRETYPAGAAGAPVAPPYGGSFSPSGLAAPGAAWGMDLLHFPLPAHQPEPPSGDDEDTYASLLPHLLAEAGGGDESLGLIDRPLLQGAAADRGGGGAEGLLHAAAGWGSAAAAADEAAWGDDEPPAVLDDGLDNFPQLAAGKGHGRDGARPAPVPTSAWGDVATSRSTTAPRRSPAAEAAAAVEAEEARMLEAAIAASLLETGRPSRARLFSEDATSSALVVVPGVGSEGFGLANATGEYNCFLNVVIQVGGGGAVLSSPWVTCPTVWASWRVRITPVSPD